MRSTQTVFVFSPDAGQLTVYPNPAQATAACAVADVRAQRYLFFAADGGPLRPEFEGEGYFLRLWASCASCSLPQILHEVRELRGAPPFDSLEAIRQQVGTQLR
ncbi:hypothetical protein [Uliginosibacterium gangwonense]|uniref:hypothetical protein n=1 Tax=Uliginosibacterium gangwonense TaxID=392736 RepID=UPI000370683F|nr:hypothetical protein [Uliginosibacterium gangwonense]